MSRCDYEGAFYRVFCVSLLMIAFTFTVILTNVFVDIDNLLNKKDKGRCICESTANVETIDIVTDGIQPTTEEPEYYIGNERNDEIDGNYRTKRSLDSENFFLHINSPKTKSYLTNRLAALLEALDESPENTTPKKDNGNIYIKTVKQKNNIEINEMRPETIDSRVQKRKNGDLLQLAMHNILLQGILGRMDMNEVYSKLQTLVTTFKYNENEKETNNAIRPEEFYIETTTAGKITLTEEQNLIQELLKYKRGDHETRDTTFEFEDAADTGSEDELGTDKKRSRGKAKSPKYWIKTLIDIKKDENAISKENFQGVIKLIYNGKPIKIRGDDHDELTVRTTRTPTTRKENSETKQTTQTTQTIETATNTINKDVEEFADVLKDNYKNKHVTDSYLKTILLEYLKKFAKSNDSSATIIEKNKIRIKRNLDWSTEKHSGTPQTKDDDELFVEIETHFDKKGLKGEKKRKLVSSLIKKIQHAIGSETKQHDKDSSEPRITKRMQNPLDHGTAPGYLENTMVTPASDFYRELNPISKSVPVSESLPHVSDKNGDTWKMQYNEPKFLSASKSINSAELGLLHVDYSKEIKEPVIPKRIQVPLTTDTSGENVNTVDVGKLQLLIKDIEGTGFSIGYNQYVDQAPDPESIKLFHGIEGIVNNYHEKHDKPNQNGDYENEYEMYGQELKKREVENSETPLRTKRFVINRHNVRRSVNEINNYRTNDYKYIYNDNYRSFDAYKEVYDSRDINTKEKGNRLQEPILKDQGKPLEVNAYRKKRSLKVRRVVNLKKKIHINKFLNTKPVPRQRRDFKISKRHKRDINNLKLNDKKKQTNDNNNMFIVSGGDMNNDHLLVRHRQSPEFFFGVVHQLKRSNANAFQHNKPYFEPNHQPRSLTSTTAKIRQLNEHKNVFDQNVSKNNINRPENKERDKRQIHSIRIIAKDMVHKGSHEKSFAEYDEDIYADRSANTPLDDPIITFVDKEDQIGIANSRTDNEQIIYRNPFAAGNNERTSVNNPLLFGHDDHAFSLDPTTQQMKDNPLMSKYPHIFVEDRTSGERPEFKHIHRTVYSRSDSKEPDTSPENEDSYRMSNLQNLVNAVVPSHRSNYKVSVKLMPRDHFNDTKPSFKEIHTTINKTYNKNGLLYSSLVNVSEISEIVELSNNKTNMNTTHSCHKHLKTTTPPNIVKPNKRARETESDLISNKQLADYTKERNKILKIIQKEPREATKEPAGQTSLMDIIIPSNPPKVIHLTVADVGKLICDSMTTTTQATTTPTVRTTTEKPEPKTTMSTTLTPTEAPTTTNKPEKRTTYANPPTVDPLKIKLLRAISQNEQLTSQILDRIDQNSGILQTFLTRISSEIAKLPEIASQAIMDKNRNYYPYETPRQMIPNFYTMNDSNISPIVYALPQPTPTQNAAAKPQNVMQATPLVKRLRVNDRMAERNIKVNNSDELKQREITKYFLDDDLNKTDPAIEGNEPQKLAIKDGSVNDKTNKKSIKRVRAVNNEITTFNLKTVSNTKNLINDLTKYSIPETNKDSFGTLNNEATRETVHTALNEGNYATNEVQKGITVDGYNVKVTVEKFDKKRKLDQNKQSKYLVKIVIDIENNKTANIREILQNLTMLMYNSNPISEGSGQSKVLNPKQATNLNDIIKPNTVKTVERDNARNENYKQILKAKTQSNPCTVTIGDNFRKAAITPDTIKKLNVPDFRKSISANDFNMYRVNYNNSPIKSSKMDDDNNEIEVFETMRHNEEVDNGNVFKRARKRNTKRKTIGFITRKQKRISQKYRTYKLKRVKREVEERKQERSTLLTNYKAFFRALRREYRYWHRILNMYPPREWLDGYWKNNVKIPPADPKVFPIVARGSRLMLEQVYGIQTDYSFMNPQSVHDVTPIRRKPE